MDITQAPSPAAKKMMTTINTPWKFFLFAFYRLPSLVFWRVKIKSLTEDQCQVTLPYGWLTQNPFRSIYFAAQCGAAELSTGMLSMIAIEGKGKVSMLVVHIESEFLKKATQKTTFTCKDGPAIQEAVQRAIETGESQTIRACSEGVQEDGTVVSRTYLTWSYKAKK